MTAPTRATEAWWAEQAGPVQLCAIIGRLHRDGGAPRSLLLRAVVGALRGASAADVAGALSARRVLCVFDAPGAPDPKKLQRAADEAMAEIKAFWTSHDPDSEDGEPPYAADAALCLAYCALEPNDYEAAKLASYAALACTFGRDPGAVAAMADAVRAELPWADVRAVLAPEGTPTADG